MRALLACVLAGIVVALVYTVYRLRVLESEILFLTSRNMMDDEMDFAYPTDPDAVDPNDSCDAHSGSCMRMPSQDGKFPEFDAPDAPEEVAAALVETSEPEEEPDEAEPDEDPEDEEDPQEDDDPEPEEEEAPPPNDSMIIELPEPPTSIVIEEAEPASPKKLRRRKRIVTSK